MALYLLLKHVNQMAAAAVVGFVTVGAAIDCVGLVNEYTALRVATGANYTAALRKTSSDTLPLLFTGRDSIAALFYGLWLLPLGYLVTGSGYIPRVLGELLVIGGYAWIADFLTGANYTAALRKTSSDTLTLLFTGRDSIAALFYGLWLLPLGYLVAGSG
jgi:hypothetical protein